MIFKLLTHENHHGYGVSLTKYESAHDPLSLKDGFVLATFDDQGERDQYVRALAGVTGFEVETLFG